MGTVESNGGPGLLDGRRKGDYSERVMPGLGELLVILVIILLLFGASRIPEIARSLGKGIKEFKKASREDPDKDAPGKK